MKLCRFTSASHPWPLVGLLADDMDPILAKRYGLTLGGVAESRVFDLSSRGVSSLTSLLEHRDLEAHLRDLQASQPRCVPLAEVQLLAPVERQEIWAAGVTYLRSKKARMEESDFSATAYDRVYEAPRPELFFKSMPEKVVGPGGVLGIRRDAKWNIPEPELVLVFNSRGELAGFSAGNDMSSRDIEGENLLYLPQAKIYQASCGLGPFIRVGVPEAEVREWTIGVQITRSGDEVMSGETSIGKMKRSFEELREWLWRSQQFPHGVMLLTGTGIVPPDEFTLAEGDVVQVTISGVGELKNSIAVV